LLVSCLLGTRVARSSCILAEGAIAQTVTRSRATLFAITKLFQFPSSLIVKVTLASFTRDWAQQKWDTSFVCLVFSSKAYALARLGALVMDVVPDEVDTCKSRCVPNLYVQNSTEVVAGKGWCLLFGACGDCCLQVLKTSAAWIVVVFGRVGARETC
jgi:hypothetical protein